MGDRGGPSQSGSRGAAKADSTQDEKRSPGEPAVAWASMRECPLSHGYRFSSVATVRVPLARTPAFVVERQSERRFCFDRRGASRAALLLIV
jgi:hypothetical protein